MLDFAKANSLATMPSTTINGKKMRVAEKKGDGSSKTNREKKKKRRGESSECLGSWRERETGKERLRMRRKRDGGKN